MTQETLDGSRGAGRALLPAMLVFLVAFASLSTDMYLPSLPTLERVFATDAARVQLTLSIFLVGFAIAQLAYGPLSDRYGRRPVLLGGLATYVLASVACLFAPSIEWLIAGRFVQAVGACCGPVLSMAMARDSYEGPRLARLMSYVASAGALTPILGPALGGVLEDRFGWQGAFVAMAGFGAVVWLFGLLALQETNRRRDPTATDLGALRRNYASLLRNRRFVGYVLVANFGYSAVFAVISGSSFLLIGTLGLSPQRFGLAFAAMVVGYVLGTLVSGRLGQRWGVDGTIARGTLLASTGSLLMLGFAVTGIETVWHFLVPAMLLNAGLGLSQPNARTGAITPFPHMAGLASAVLGFSGMMIASVVGVLVAHFADGSGLSMAMGMAGGSVAALLVFTVLIRRTP